MLAVRKLSIFTGLILAAISGCADGGPPRALSKPNATRQAASNTAADASAPPADVGHDASDALADAGEPDAAMPDAQTMSINAEEALCDGAPGITFSVAAIGGGISPPGTEVMAENGHSFVIVEGTCRFWALRGRLEQVVTGVLTAADLARLREDFELDRWRNCRGRYSTGAADAPEFLFVFGRSGRITGDFDECMDGPSISTREPGDPLSAYQRTLERLSAAGTPVAGDIRYLLLQMSSKGVSGPEAKAGWPLGDPADVALSLMSVAHSAYQPGSSRLAQGRDAAALREIWLKFLEDEHRRRPSSPPAPEGVPIEVDGTRYELYLRDSIPLEDSRGLISY